MEITAKATLTLTLTFDTRDGFLATEEEAYQEMVDYLLTGPPVGEFTITTSTP